MLTRSNLVVVGLTLIFVCVVTRAIAVAAGCARNHPTTST